MRIFNALCCDDFSTFFKDSVIQYKTAHTFIYKGKAEHLRELKLGKKDRIYIYPYSGNCGRYVFVFEAIHKDQQNTADEVKRYAERTIKNIIDADLLVLLG